MQVQVGSRADARRISQPNVLSLHSKVESKQPVATFGIAAERHQTAASVGCERFNLQAILIEREGTVDVA